MSSRTLFGIETEYALTAERENGQPLSFVRINMINELLSLARERLQWLPGGNNTGMFLGNGSRFYLDLGNHPEFCTPECMTPEEGVRWLLAGERILADLMDEVGKLHPNLSLNLIRCNVDYSGRHSTWGCHESYCVERSQQTLAVALIPHLVSRIVITGAGGFDNTSDSDALENSTRAGEPRFLISPRVPHFAHAAVWTPGSPRALIHDRRESLSHSRFDRLHLMCGESLNSQLSNYLKLGTTALVIKLAEVGISELERLAFAKPLEAMLRYAEDPTCRAKALLLDGRNISAIEVQRHYLEAAEQAAACGTLPDWAPETCRRWRRTLDLLEQGPEAVATQLDWAIKLALFRSQEESSRRQGVPFAKLAEIDTRFGQIGAESIFSALEASGALDHQIEELGSVEEAMTRPPPGGRAEARGRAIAELSGQSGCMADWDRVLDDGQHRALDLCEPFESAPVWEPRQRRQRGGRDNLPEIPWDNRSEGEAAVQLGYDLYEGMHLEEAISHLNRATALLAGEPDACWEANFWLATCLHDLGRIDQADQIIRRTLAQNRESVSPGNLALVYSRYGFTLIDRFAPIAEIERHLGEMKTICHSFGTGVGSSRRSLLRGRLSGARGRNLEAIDAVEHAIQQSRIDSVALVGSALTRTMVRSCARAGEFERASRIVEVWNVDQPPVGGPNRHRYRRTEVAILHLYKGEPERAYEIAAPLVESVIESEDRYSIHASCILARAALATGRLSVARNALVKALRWQRTKLGELRFEILAVHLAYLEACHEQGLDDPQGELSGALSPSIRNVRRAARRHARKLDSQLDTHYWTQSLAGGWHG